MSDVDQQQIIVPTDERRKPVVKVSGIELDYLSGVVARLPNEEDED